MKSIGSIVLPLFAVVATAWCADSKDDQSRAVAQIEKAGGIVMFDEKLPERPATAVDFHENTATDACLAALARLPQLQRLRIVSSSKSAIVKLIIDSPRITEAGLANLKDLGNLRQLALSGNNITDAALAHLAGLRQLEELTLDGENITDAGLAHVAQLPNLQKLTIAEIDGERITDAGLARLAELKILKSLAIGMYWLQSADTPQKQSMTVLTELNNSPGISNETLKIIGRLLQLEELYLCSPRIGSEGLKSISDLKNLRVLHLNCTPLDTAGLSYLAALPQLRTLDLAGSFSRRHHPVLSFDPQNRPDLSVVKGMEKLEVLDLSFNTIDDDDLLRLQAPPHLKELSLRSTNVTGPGLASLADLNELEKLDLSENLLQGKCLKPLGGLKRLEFLELHRHRDDEHGFDDHDLANLKDAVQLKHLGLSNTDVSDAGLALLQGLTQLRSLRLLRTRVEGPGLANLKNMSQLQELAIDLDHLSDSELEHLKGFTQMKRIQLIGQGNRPVKEPGVITDRGIASLIGMTQLEELVLLGEPFSPTKVQLTAAGLAALSGLAQLKSFYLSSSSITNGDLIPLARMRQLQHLSLRGCHKLTDLGMGPIGALRNLKELDLVGVNLTEEGLNYFKDLARLETIVLLDHSGLFDRFSREQMNKKIHNMLPKTRVVWE
jgi:Leucine-rich repeat (LRR) protein